MLAIRLGYVVALEEYGACIADPFAFQENRFDSEASFTEWLNQLIPAHVLSVAGVSAVDRYEPEFVAD